MLSCEERAELQTLRREKAQGNRYAFEVELSDFRFKAKHERMGLYRDFSPKISQASLFERALGRTPTFSEYTLCCYILECNKNNKTHISNKELSKNIRVSIQSVSRIISQLLSAGMLKRTGGKHGKGRMLRICKTWGAL